MDKWQTILDLLASQEGINYRGYKAGLFRGVRIDVKLRNGKGIFLCPILMCSIRISASSILASMRKENFGNLSKRLMSRK
ncbi:hypothetical protein HYT01_00110 [Candidatus Giovannonibacteria bacterium]|nr:hypothetical protein [Candidatus Giovannonibacteria bacterium]